MRHEEEFGSGSKRRGARQYLGAGGGGKRRLTLTLMLVCSLVASACTSASREPQQDAQQPIAGKNPAYTTGAANANMSSGTLGRISREEQSDTEAYSRIEENPFFEVARAPLSTFSIDVDTASYSNMRRFIREGRLPPKDAVRIEELINYFPYEYPQPAGSAPFSVTAEVAECPWNNAHRLVHIGLQGKRIELQNVPPANLVFLLDVSGSMNDPNKLPLLKSALAMLVEQLRPNDRVAIVVYAGSSGLVLPSTPGSRSTEILAALDNLQAGGSTNGGEGIRLAYRVAQENFIQGGTNRVILATDGDFNVGTTSEGELVGLIEEKRQSGVFLSVLGFGTGNLKDSTMEKLADKGNGHYAYIDSMAEARKVLGGELGGSIATIAKDVKIQVEFNPKQVAGYRLIGYENRLLHDRDFNDDTKDAGEIGAGHSVTALYEIVPAGQKVEGTNIDALKYQQQEPLSPSNAADSREMMTVKLRYKEPSADESKLLSVGVADGGGALQNASDNFKFSSAVAGFGMLLRDSKHKGSASYERVLQLARASTGTDLHGYRSEFVQLVESAKRLSMQ
ncbi:MAG TPA: VWA domain-containing protein [Pyrinomonadaceae bacterium]|jgi:Ca-activated chloride channel family protein